MAGKSAVVSLLTPGGASGTTSVGSLAWNAAVNAGATYGAAWLSNKYAGENYSKEDMFRSAAAAGATSVATSIGSKGIKNVALQQMATSAIGFGMQKLFTGEGDDASFWGSVSTFNFWSNVGAERAERIQQEEKANNPQPERQSSGEQEGPWRAFWGSLGIVTGIRQTKKWLGEVYSAVSGAVSDFGESTLNLFKKGRFATRSELKQEKWEERRLLNDIESGSYKKPQKRSEQMVTPERVIEQAAIDSQQGNYSGSNEPGILDKIMSWFTWGDERRRQQDIQECKEMWDSGKMEKMIDDRYEYLDDQYRERVIKERGMVADYNSLGVDADGKPIYVVTYSSDSEAGKERLAYYKHVAERNNQNLEDDFESREFVVFGQEGKGVRMITAANEEVNDRITFIIKNGDDYTIQEYYRSTIDAGTVDWRRNHNQESWQTQGPDVAGYRTFGPQIQNSIASGVYDINYGLHMADGQECFGFNVYDFEGNIGAYDVVKQQELRTKYENGTLSFQDLTTETSINSGHDLTRVNSVDLQGNIHQGGQRWINLHGGGLAVTGSLACSTIQLYDMNYVQQLFESRFGTWYASKINPGKRGRYYVEQ